LFCIAEGLEATGSSEALHALVELPAPVGGVEALGGSELFLGVDVPKVEGIGHSVRMGL
jgi:hypothetical protein